MFILQVFQSTECFKMMQLSFWQFVFNPFGAKIQIVLGLVSSFNGISTLFRLFNAKAILLEEQ